MVQGHLHEVMRTYERALQRALEQGTPPLRGTADMYVGMSGLHRERNDLQTATQHLLRSKELGEHTGLPQNRYRWCVAMARIREAQGDLDSALDLLHEAERLYVGDFSPNVRPIAASVSRVWVAQGKIGEALNWVRERRLSVSDEPSYLREFEHITLVRVLLAWSTSNSTDSSIREAMGLLERLLQAAEEGKRTGSVIEILVLQALVHQMQGNILAALVPLGHALTLAEPEGYIRIFVDEGPPMALLLEVAAKHGIAPNYVRHLLTAFGSAEDRTSVETGFDRATLGTGAGSASATRNRLERPRNCPRTRGIPEHHAYPHQKHLQQTRGERPSGSSPPGEGTQIVLMNPHTNPGHDRVCRITCRGFFSRLSAR